MLPGKSVVYFGKGNIASHERAFEIEYTHHSTAIEGNTLALMETKLVFKDRISVGGKRLRELYEPINHEKAFRYVKDCVGKGYALDEKIVKDIHVMPMQNILAGGVYRNAEFVKIYLFPDGNVTQRYQQKAA